MSQSTTTTTPRTATDDTRSISSGSTIKWYRITMVDHLDINCKILYDVEGNILIDRNSIVLNVYKPAMRKALDSKEVRVIRNSTTSELCYRYFITSQAQFERFDKERQFGTREPNKAYHVYVDVDCRDSPAYKRKFIPTREINQPYV